MESKSLNPYGWNSYFQEQLELIEGEGLAPARVVSESRNSYDVAARQGELKAKISGSMRYRLDETGRRPAVGDWVAITTDGREAVIQAVLPRKSRFSRQAAGERTEEQVVAANIDTVFIVNGLDGGRSFNLRRIERYLTLAWNSGASPVIILNKADLCPDMGAYLDDVESVAAGIPVHSVSAIEGTGLDALKGYLKEGRTVAFLGSSGVGKSALINALLGSERQQTGAIREDDHEGRHTTTRRELILIPGGAAVIDTPGMRELQLWAEQEDLDTTFNEISAIAAGCRFADCGHDNEPGCAVREAIEQGLIDEARLESYRKLKKELDFHAAKEEGANKLLGKARWKKISKLQRQYKKITGRE
jgi:ribosome biogenesis GTPase